MSKYGHRAHNWFEAIVNKLGGEEQAEAFLRGELEIKTAERTFPIWKTIKLGTGLRTADDFRRALKDNGFRIGDWANDLLGRPAFKASETETEADLVSITVAELGFKNGATRADIYKQAMELGLELCPAEVGPQLRLQYSDQSMGEWLLIGMEPIAVLDGDLRVFFVDRCDAGAWLSSYYGYPDRFWNGDDRWVFVRGPAVSL